MLKQPPQKGRFPGLRLTYVVLVGILLFSGCSESPSLEVTRRFHSAEKVMKQAGSPADYQRAATAYQEILDGGFYSGVVLFNQGNAWMQAGRRGRAIASYRQAKRLLPRDPYLDANLRQAIGDQPEQDAHLLDYVFFWQASTTVQEMSMTATILLLLAMLASMCVQVKYKPTIARVVSIVSFVTLALVAGSLFRDWWQHEGVEHGVVVVSEVEARKGASNNHPVSFNQALMEGTEFTVIKGMDGWLHVQVGNKGRGWIPERDAVTW